MYDVFGVVPALTIQYLCIPTCHSDLGPATEYGLLAVVLPSPRKAVLIGSVSLIALLTLFRLTLYPIARSLPNK